MRCTMRILDTPSVWTFKRNCLIDVVKGSIEEWTRERIGWYIFAWSPGIATLDRYLPAMINAKIDKDAPGFGNNQAETQEYRQMPLRSGLVCQLTRTAPVDSWMVWGNWYFVLSTHNGIGKGTLRLLKRTGICRYLIYMGKLLFRSLLMYVVPLSILC